MIFLLNRGQINPLRVCVEVVYLTFLQGGLGIIIKKSESKDSNVSRDC